MTNKHGIEIYAVFVFLFVHLKGAALKNPASF